MSTSIQPITKHSSGSFRELFAIQLPLLLSLLSGSLMGFCDRLFLAKYSLEAFEAVSYAIYICMIFQLGCMRITSASQILISKSVGEGDLCNVGKYTWQMIWFSVASILITWPISQAMSSYFFPTGEISSSGQVYFQWMMLFNFLFPLGTSLASFFTGIGQASVITRATLVSHSFNIALNYPLIFGIPNLIPPLGASGAAIASGISQSIYCVLLLIQLMRQKYFLYGTRFFKLKIEKLVEVLHIGIPTSAARIHNLFIWSLMMKILVEQGELYLLALSYGSMLSFLLGPLNESMAQSLMTLFSYYLGAAKRKICHVILLKANLIALLNAVVVSVTLIFFGKELIENFSNTIFNETSFHMLKSNTAALSVYFFVESLVFIGFSWALSQGKPMQVALVGMSCTLIFGYGGFNLAFNLLGCPARYTWWVIAAHLVPPIPLYYLRGRSKQAQPRLNAHS